MGKLHLEIVTPEGLIFSNDVKMVVLPGSEGEFGVLPSHASLVSLLKVGVIDIEMQDGHHEVVAIDWGYAEVNENKVVVLANGAVYVSGNSESELAKSLQKAKDLITAMSDSNPILAAAISKMDTVARSK